MSNALLLRKIYAELRSVAGIEISAGDLLRLANFVLRAFKSDFIEEGENARSRGRSVAFHALPVDEAMQDGGWRVLSFEEPSAKQMDEVDSAATLYLNSQLTKYLGHEWQRLTPPG